MGVVDDEVNPVRAELGEAERYLLELPATCARDGFRWVTIPAKRTRGKKDGPFSWQDADTLDVEWTETGMAYGESKPSSETVSFSVELGKHPVGAEFHVSLEPVVRWGINFAATVAVFRKEGDERGHAGTVYVTGKRTYDPAGRTGDPHASERVSEAAACAQAFVTCAQLVALRSGADRAGIEKIQEACRPLVARYHGRLGLYDWMFSQVATVALELSAEEVAYPAYLASLPSAAPADANEHTQEYLASYARGAPVPPLHFFRSCAAAEAGPEFAAVLAQKEAADEGTFFPTFVVLSVLFVVVAILAATHLTDPGHADDAL